MCCGTHLEPLAEATLRDDLLLLDVELDLLVLQRLVDRRHVLAALLQLLQRIPPRPLLPPRLHRVRHRPLQQAVVHHVQVVELLLLAEGLRDGGAELLLEGLVLLALLQLRGLVLDLRRLRRLVRRAVHHPTLLVAHQVVIVVALLPQALVLLRRAVHLRLQRRNLVAAHIQSAHMPAHPTRRPRPWGCLGQRGEAQPTGPPRCSRYRVHPP